MKSKVFKYTLLGMLFLFLCISVLLLVKNNQLKGEIASLDDVLAKTERKAKGLKKKYAEEKAKGSALQRAKLAADAEKRELETTITELKKRTEASQGSKDRLISQLKGKIGGFEKKLDQLSKRNDGLKNEYFLVASKLKQAVGELKIRDADLAKRKGDIQSLTSQLNITMRKLERAVGHNKKLAGLAEDLLVQFDEKGFFSSMLEKEPFTQKKRLHLERMIQEYMDRIDKETLVTSDGF